MIGLPGLRNRKVVAQRSVGELDAMAAAGSLVACALLAVRQAAAPGVSTLALDEIAESVIRGGGGIPSFLGYHGFPASICASVNDRVVHGIPSASETLAPACAHAYAVASPRPDEAPVIAITRPLRSKQLTPIIRA